jgi:LmbE family N-acetylglucosaminyl deacetylase
MSAAFATAGAFNPAFPGTDESIWQQVLADQEAWVPRPGPLLVVSPHPDDEVLGAGGLMRMWSAWRHNVALVSVTDGEAAYPDWRDLGGCRRAELDCALGVLGASRIHRIQLGLPDGGGDANVPALREALAILCELKPTLIAPYECDGHPDHEAAGQVCLEIAREFDLPIARYPIWAWHHGGPQNFAGLRIGRFALDAAAQAAKAGAMECFASQLAPGEARAPIVPAHVLSYFRRDFEAFVL